MFREMSATLGNAFCTYLEQKKSSSFQTIKQKEIPLNNIILSYFYETIKKTHCCNISEEHIYPYVETEPNPHLKMSIIFF